MNKHFYIIILFLIHYTILFGQNEEERDIEISIGIGGIVFTDDFGNSRRTVDSDFYLDSGFYIKNEGGLIQSFPGYRFEIAFPTKLNNLRFYTGFTYQGKKDYYSNYDVERDNGIDGNVLYIGGGTFVGISLKTGNNKFGLLSKIGIGYFTYKYQRSMTITQNQGADNYQNRLQTEISKSIFSSSVGSTFDFGFYLSMKKITLNPSFHTIVTGSKGLTFTPSGGSLMIIYN